MLLRMWDPLLVPPQDSKLTRKLLLTVSLFLWGLVDRATAPLAAYRITGFRPSRNKVRAGSAGCPNPSSRKAVAHNGWDKGPQYGVHSVTQDADSSDRDFFRKSYRASYERRLLRGFPFSREVTIVDAGRRALARVVAQLCSAALKAGSTVLR